MEEKGIKVARYRNSEYVVNFLKTNGQADKYIWFPSKGKSYTVKELPRDVVDYLLLNSVCFKDGELVIIEDSEEAKDVVDSIEEIDEYKNNTHSKEDIAKILNMTTSKMKTELNKITNPQEKGFIIDVAKEIKLDSSEKLNFLAKWMNVPIDILFTNDEDEKVAE